jgi:hypothetical protein
MTRSRSVVICSLVLGCVAVLMVLVAGPEILASLRGGAASAPAAVVGTPGSPQSPQHEVGTLSPASQEGPAVVFGDGERPNADVGMSIEGEPLAGEVLTVTGVVTVPSASLWLSEQSEHDMHISLSFVCDEGFDVISAAPATADCGSFDYEPNLCWRPVVDVGDPYTVTVALRAREGATYEQTVSLFAIDDVTRHDSWGASYAVRIAGGGEPGYIRKF